MANFLQSGIRQFQQFVSELSANNGSHNNNNNNNNNNHPHYGPRGAVPGPLPPFVHHGLRGYRGPPPPRSAAAAAASAAAAAAPPISGRPPPASSKALGALPMVQVTADDLQEVTNKECLVCLEDHLLGAWACKLPCGHLFHRACLVEWLEKQCTCPVCRYELETGDAQYELARKQRMKKRKLRFRLDEIKMKRISELRELAASMSVDISGCIDKSEIIQLLIDSGNISVTEAVPNEQLTAKEFQSKKVSELKHMLLSLGISTEGAIEKEDLRKLLMESGRIDIVTEPLEKEAISHEESSSSAEKGNSTYVCVGDIDSGESGTAIASKGKGMTDDQIASSAFETFCVEIVAWSKVEVMVNNDKTRGDYCDHLIDKYLASNLDILDSSAVVSQVRKDISHAVEKFASDGTLLSEVIECQQQRQEQQVRDKLTTNAAHIADEQSSSNSSGGSNSSSSSSSCSSSSSSSSNSNLSNINNNNNNNNIIQTDADTDMNRHCAATAVATVAAADTDIDACVEDGSTLCLSRELLSSFSVREIKDILSSYELDDSKCLERNDMIALMVACPDIKIID